MKRKVGILAAVLALGATVYLVSNLWAQQAAPGMASVPQVTKVAVVNMYVVMKNYKKVDLYRNQLQGMAEPYEKKDKEYKDGLKGWTAVAQDAKKSKEERDQAEKHVTTLKRLIEDNAQTATKLITSKQEEQIVQMYREIEDAVKAYSRANGIHLVLHHNEALAENEFYSAANIQRKMKGVGMSGAAGALYIGDGLEIAPHIVNILNSRGG